MEYQDLFAGLTTFTVSNDKGDHYTYKITRKDSEQYGEKYFVNLLSGPDNENSYSYMGLLMLNSNLILTRASKFKEESLSVQVFNFAMRILEHIQEMPKGYDILPAGKCFRCGRKLTTPESIKSGYGPYCRSQI